MTCAHWGRALSSIRLNSGPTALAHGLTNWSRISLQYLYAVSVPLSITYTWDFPLTLIAYQNHEWALAITVMFCHFNSSTLCLGILYTNWRLSVKSRPNLDSSVNSTGVQSRIVHLTRVLVMSNLSCTCCLVNGSVIGGLLAFNPNSWSLFLTVCVEIQFRS